MTVSIGTQISLCLIPLQCQAQHLALSRNLEKYWLNWTELETEIDHGSILRVALDHE